MVPNERTDAYRQLRIMVDPVADTGQMAVAVVARTSRGGAHRDRLLLRRTFAADLEIDTIAGVLQAAAELLAGAARELERPAP
jgi:hypothetical protein